MTRSIAPTATILIINPDPITTLGIAAVLDMQGYECHYACDVESARRAMSSLLLDLIICDTEITEAAVERIQQWKTDASVQDVPVIFVTERQRGDRTEMPTSCATFWLDKPFDPDQLIELVSKALWMPHLISARLRQSHMPNASAVPAPAAARRSSTSEQRR